MDKIKQEILKTATNAFVKKGIRSVSVDDICDNLRISKKTFYSYYRQKEALVMAVVETFTTHHQEYHCMLQNQEFTNVIDEILWMKTLIKNGKEEKKHERFFNDLLKYYPSIYNTFSVEKRQYTEQMFLNQIEKGIAQGIFREDIHVQFTAQSLTVSLQYFINMSIKHPRKYTKLGIIDFMVDSYLRMVCNEKGLLYYTSLLT